MGTPEKMFPFAYRYSIVESTRSKMFGDVHNPNAVANFSVAAFIWFKSALT